MTTVADLKYKPEWYFRRISINQMMQLAAAGMDAERQGKVAPMPLPENEDDGELLMVIQGGLRDTYTGGSYHTVACAEYNEDTLAADAFRIIEGMESHERCELFKVGDSLYYDPHAPGNDWKGPNK